MSASPIRVRFAPSPTGALHIGGVRTALYNYLFARQQGGKFILRIEDTDQTRYEPRAEAYILEALDWFGLVPDEGPRQGGDFGPYRQSERRELYAEYTQRLLDSGAAYYAFDTPEELNAQREAAQAAGEHAWKYDAATRGQLKNSLALPAAETERLLAAGTPYVVRLRVDPGHTVVIDDLIRGRVEFQSDELDDKVLMKADGLPTYHLANIVDDHLMEISHVIRGEEWLPSTAHHVLLYQAFGWGEEMPQFAHLPLIMKPTGKGKLSKRDGQQLGIPVFPLAWAGATEEQSFTGFREFGFDPEAALNFLALLGWNPGTEQEVFSREALIAAFSLEKIGKSGARFDFDKAKWFNQQYIIHADADHLLDRVRPVIAAHGHQPGDDYLRAFIELLRERVVFYEDFWTQGYYFFEPVRSYDEKTIRKKWKPATAEMLAALRTALKTVSPYRAPEIKAAIEAFMQERELGFGAVFPFLRIALSGTVKGPGVYEMIELLGPDTVDERLAKASQDFSELIS
jgi:glutamyl-tRNA synthetase